METAHHARGARPGLARGEQRAIDTGKLNLEAAAALLRGLIRGGVRRAVISPGSRSSPLALAAHGSPLLETSVLPDERSAAFFALGLARGGGSPVAVIATSGTAPANWYPALIESSMDDVPLVFISADRPYELLGVGANQTVEQDGMFAGYPRASIRLPAPDGTSADSFESIAGRMAERAVWPRRGPVHINIAFREPLLPGDGDPPVRRPEPTPPSNGRPVVGACAKRVSELAATISGRAGVLVCGRGLYPDAFAGTLATLAGHIDCPIIADPLSGLRWGDHDRSRVITTADLATLGEPGGGKAGWIIQFGAAPTSRPVQDWIAGHAGRLTLADPFGDWQDPTHAARDILRSDPLPLVEALLDAEPDPGPPAWCAGWRDRDAELAALCDDPDSRPPEADLIQAIETGLPASANLFIGNSMPVRSLDTFARGREPALRAFGNRGASGIDGCVSTIAGLAAHGGATTGLIGDLALYHDMNGLLAVRQTDATVVVINNGGGAIFGLLPQRDRPEFERLWMTPTGLDLERVAGLYDLAYSRAMPGEDLGMTQRGPRLIEVRIDAELSWARHRALRDAARRL